MSRLLCRLDDLPDGGARGFGPFESRAAKIVLVRRQGRVFAYRDACPHYGDTPMAWRTDEYLNAERSHIVCASHGALFAIETGECVLGPALGKSLDPAPIRVTNEGDVLLLDGPTEV
jgi:nitrite reductase/ring-hydroxylating ferredoxin subunit